MTLTQLLWILLQAFSASFALTMGILNYSAWRQQNQLNALLQHLCMQAWAMKGYPLLTAYLDYAELELTVTPRHHGTRLPAAHHPPRPARRH